MMTKTITEVSQLLKMMPQEIIETLDQNKNIKHSVIDNQIVFSRRDVVRLDVAYWGKKDRILKNERSLFYNRKYQWQTTDDIDLAKSIEDLRPKIVRGMSSDEIKQTVAAHFELTVEDLESTSFVRFVNKARQIAMYFMKTNTNLTMMQIGAKFNRVHSTVIHAMDCIQKAKKGL